MSLEYVREQLDRFGVSENEFAEILDDASAGLDAYAVAEDVYSDGYGDDL